METRDIHDVPWASLHHAYGEATDVPGQLLALLSDDEEVRAEARDELLGNIHHQGTVYEASAHAVPFLLRFAANTDVADREHILALLALLARGSSYHDVHRFLDQPKTPEDAAEYQTLVRQELADVVACRAAVCAGMNVFASLLDDPSPSVRNAAAYAIAALEEDGASQANLIAAKAAREPDPEAAASMILALTAIKAPPALLDAIAASSPAHPITALALSLAAITLGPDDARPADVLVAVRAMENPPELAHEISEILWFDNGVGYVSLSFVAAKRPELLLPHMDVLLRLLRSKQMDEDRLVRVILHIAFADRVGKGDTSADALSPEQRKIVVALMDSECVFSLKRKRQEVLFDAAGTLRRYGLPGDAKAFKKLADECRGGILSRLRGKA